MTNEPTEQLSVALQAAQRILAAVRDDQWSEPTPCTEWSVRQLVTHMVVGNQAFASILRGDAPASAEQVLGVSPDLKSAYVESATAVVDAFRQPGVLDRVFPFPFGRVPGIVGLHLRITEILVHGWDLGRAIGQPLEVPEDLAEQELVFTRDKLGDVPAERSPFAPPQPVADDAPAIDRLAACLGRTIAADAAPGARPQTP